MAQDERRLRTEELRCKISETEAELTRLWAQLAAAEAEETTEATQADHPEDESKLQATGVSDDNNATNSNPPNGWKWPLPEESYERYARQLILPGIGVRGQLRIEKSSILLVGAGGLGCPAAMYLAGAGIGRLGILDGDTVEASNLHRQIGHCTAAASAGTAKAASLADTLHRINPRPQYDVLAENLTPANAVRLVSAYDVVLDCTDRPATRYLVSDACVRAGRPLVSAAALRTDGQLSVLNWPVGRGPCYRCMFPRPPPVGSQQSCAEGGVLGPVVGVMGVLQALEALRIVVDESVQGGEECDQGGSSLPSPSLLLLSAADGKGKLATPAFRTVRLRGRRADCFACAKGAPLQRMASLTEVDGAGGEWPDYVEFCGRNSVEAGCELTPEERVSVSQLSGLSKKGSEAPFWLLDVREKEFFDMGGLDGSINVPFSKIQAACSVARRQKQGSPSETAELDSLPDWLPKGLATDSAPVYVLCRMGINSQAVVRQLKDMGLDRGGERLLADVRGGVLAWKREVDHTIPFA